MKLKIKQTKKIRGEITISGSKNATLPILAVSILTNEKIKERIDSRQGREIWPYAEKLGLGTREYELIDIDE